MWPLLLACSQPPTPETVPPGGVALQAPWLEFELPVEGARILIARPDSLIVEGATAAMSVKDWQQAIEARGWLQTAANDGEHGLFARTFANPAEPTAKLLFGVTQRNDLSTHSLLWTAL